MKIAKVTLSALVLVLIFRADLSSKIRVRQLCDLVGFTLISCTSISYDMEVKLPRLDDPIRLDNGMVFKAIGLGPIGPIFGERVAIFAAKTTSTEEDFTLYALLIEDQDQVYRVMRLR